MTHKSSYVGDIPSVPVAEFGDGTLSLVPAVAKEGKWLLLKSQEPHEIGSQKEHGCKDGNEFKPDMGLLFKNVESLDVLISTLQETRESFTP